MYIFFIIKCGVELLIYFQTSTVQPLMFRNGWVILIPHHIGYAITYGARSHIKTECIIKQSDRLDKKKTRTYTGKIASVDWNNRS